MANIQSSLNIFQYILFFISQNSRTNFNRFPAIEPVKMLTYILQCNTRYFLKGTVKLKMIFSMLRISMTYDWYQLDSNGTRVYVKM